MTMLGYGLVLLVFYLVCFEIVKSGNGSPSSRDPNLGSEPRQLNFKAKTGRRSDRRLDPVTHSFKPVGPAPQRTSLRLTADTKWGSSSKPYDGFNVGSRRWLIASKPSMGKRLFEKEYKGLTDEQIFGENKEALAKILSETDPCLTSEKDGEVNCAKATAAYVSTSDGKGCQLADAPEPKCRDLWQEGEKRCSVKRPRWKFSLKLWWLGGNRYYYLNTCADNEFKGGFNLANGDAESPDGINPPFRR